LGKRAFSFLIKLLVLFLLPIAVFSAKRQLAPGEAENLVRHWFTSQGYDTNPSRFILDRDPDQAAFPEFYFYSANAHYDEQSESAPSLGHFAVNRQTADLWDWELCKKLQDPELRSIQTLLRRKLGLSKKEYQKLSKVAPCSGTP